VITSKGQHLIKGGLCSTLWGGGVFIYPSPLSELLKRKLPHKVSIRSWGHPLMGVKWEGRIWGN